MESVRYHEASITPHKKVVLNSQFIITENYKAAHTTFYTIRK